MRARRRNVENNMNNYCILRDKSLAFFFTYGVSLKDWYDTGLIDREVALYNKLSNYVKHIYIFTYGDRRDLQLKNYLASNVSVIPMPFINISKNPFFSPLMLLYSFLIPFIHHKTLKNVHILKTNQMNGSWSAVISKILFKKKLVIRTGYTWSIFNNESNNSSLKNIIITFIEKFAYFFSDVVIVTSYNDLLFLENRYRIKGIKNVIPNYVDINTFKPLNIKKMKNSICFVGRLVEQKNLFSLLDALTSLPYSLNIIGSGQQRGALEEYAKAKNIDIKFLGIVPNRELPYILNQNEIFILPSFYEGMPKVLLEAMACGLPVIGADVNGIKEIIEHNDNGLLCGTDSLSIRKAIMLLINDENLKNTISLKARVTIKEKYSLNNYLKIELNLYNILINKNMLR